MSLGWLSCRVANESLEILHLIANCVIIEWNEWHKWWNREEKKNFNNFQCRIDTNSHYFNNLYSFDDDKRAFEVEKN